MDIKLTIYPFLQAQRDRQAVDEAIAKAISREEATRRRLSPLAGPYRIKGEERPLAYFALMQVLKNPSRKAALVKKGSGAVELWVNNIS